VRKSNSAVPGGTIPFTACTRHLLRGVPGYFQSRLRRLRICDPERES
jgi:hypothetical protein